MKRFIKNGIAFVVGVFILLSLGTIIPAKWINENWHYALADKHQLLNNSAGSQRILLLGGSNVSFGFYSPHIEEAFGIPVINTGIHAGYGLKYMMDDLLPYINQQDLVVVVPEYANFYGDAFYGGEPMLNSLIINPQNFKTLNGKQWAIVFENLPKYSLLKLRFFMQSWVSNTQKKNAYHRTAFNQNGDVVKHWGEKNKAYANRPVKGDFNQAAFNYLLSFQKEVKEKGAKIYFGFPSLNQGSYTGSEDAIARLKDSLIAHDFSLVGNPQAYISADSVHYDSYYHLNQQGQLERTAQFISDFSSLLEDGNH